MNEAQTSCRNCNAPLAGEYCSQCGQREGRGDLSFGAVFGEIVEEFFNWDSRFWRTLLPLLFRPGYLTAEFIAGRRARYVPPFRLYLIISFVLFLVVSLLAGGSDFIHVYKGDNEAAGAAVGKTDPVTEAEDAPSAITAGAEREGDEIVSADIGIRLAEEHSPRWLKDLERRLEQNAGKISDDPGVLVQQLVEYLPQMMFLLLPVFALLLKCCYLFSPAHYLQHLVFSLHFHSFVYLLYLIGALIDTWLTVDAVGLPLVLVLVLYLSLGLKRTYGSGLAGAAGKAVAILIIEAVMLLMVLALFILVTLTFI